MIDLDAPVSTTPLAFLDVETTGLSAHSGDRICEVAVLRVLGDEAVDALQALVHPQRPMGRGAYAVHRISDAMLAGKPPFASIVDDLLAVTDGAVVVGHNLGFDLGFLRAEFARAGREMPPCLGLCTLRLARSLYRLPGYGLAALATALGVRRGGRGHRAMSDVVVTREVFGHISEDLDAAGVRSLRGYLTLQGGDLGRRSRPAGALGDPDVPDLIRQALASRATLHIRYRSPEGGETERTVTPLDVDRSGGRLALVAFCHLRGARRLFRIDRIAEMTLLGPGGTDA